MDACWYKRWDTVGDFPWSALVRGERPRFPLCARTHPRQGGRIRQPCPVDCATRADQCQNVRRTPAADELCDAASSGPGWCRTQRN